MSLDDQQADVSGRALRGEVLSVSRNDTYSFSKPTREEIVLIPGLGVEGDVHAGVTVRHRSRVRADPAQPNLRQVHLIHAELHDEVRPEGYEVPPGGLGENVTTAGLDLLTLPCGTVLRFGPPAPPSRPPARSSARSSAWETASASEDPGRPGRAADGSTDPASAGLGSAGLGATGCDAAEMGATDPGPAERGAAVLGSTDPGLADWGSAEPGLTDSGSIVRGAAAVVEAARAATLDEAAAAAVAALAARIGAESSANPDNHPAIVITGLRNPCQQINRYRSGLLKQVLGRDERGNVVRKAGVMAVVLRGGAIRPGDAITVDLPAGPHRPLDRV